MAASAGERGNHCLVLDNSRLCKSNISVLVYNVQGPNTFVERVLSTQSDTQTCEHFRSVGSGLKSPFPHQALWACFSSVAWRSLWAYRAPGRYGCRAVFRRAAPRTRAFGKDARSLVLLGTTSEHVNKSFYINPNCQKTTRLMAAYATPSSSKQLDVLIHVSITLLYNWQTAETSNSRLDQTYLCPRTASFRFSQ